MTKKIVEKKIVIDKRNDSKRLVTIVLGEIDSVVAKDWHCHACGRIVFQYWSEVRIIIDGESREVRRPVDIFCSRCKLCHRVA